MGLRAKILFSYDDSRHKFYTFWPHGINVPLHLKVSFICMGKGTIQNEMKFLLPS